MVFGRDVSAGDPLGDVRRDSATDGRIDAASRGRLALRQRFDIGREKLEKRTQHVSFEIGQTCQGAEFFSRLLRVSGERLRDFVDTVSANEDGDATGLNGIKQGRNVGLPDAGATGNVAVDVGV